MVYNPGGQRGKSVRGGGQRPAKDPKGPFLGKSAMGAHAKRSTPATKPGASRPDRGKSERRGRP
jgi:hypothetical protein